MCEREKLIKDSDPINSMDIIPARTNIVGIVPAWATIVSSSYLIISSASRFSSTFKDSFLVLFNIISCNKTSTVRLYS